ncbi:MAG: hypothetical protein IV090_20870 [Candidatus Sericytochromatia bacterium]|nr:hypothetical protein [Candidatus Sericytochromatia bacterium]
MPIPIIETYPNNTNSADLTMIGKGNNGKDYAIKTVGDVNGYVPCSEVFCYELAMRLGIGTPDYTILELDGGELAFGSVWEGGVFDLQSDLKILQILTGHTQIAGLADSAIRAVLPQRSPDPLPVPNRKQWHLRGMANPG